MSLRRLRRVLFIKAYRALPEGTTLEELLKPHARENRAGDLVLHRDALNRAINANVDEVLLGGADEIKLETFLDFLYTGTAPPSCPKQQQQQQQQPEEQARAVVLRAGTLLATRGKPPRPPLPSKPRWRKQEIVRQERIVHYTTVDSDGTVQELVETERSSTEVTHMECNETGEFAHREASEYEQLETFNRQIVAMNHGNEEYVHLKSKEDEIEFVDSNNMPQQRTAPAAAEHQQSPVNQNDDAAPEYVDDDNMNSISRMQCVEDLVDQESMAHVESAATFVSLPPAGGCSSPRVAFYDRGEEPLAEYYEEEEKDLHFSSSSVS